MASNEPRARNFDLVPDPRITIPARGMSWPHLRGLKHDRTRSRAQKVRENPCIEGGIQTCTPVHTMIMDMTVDFLVDPDHTFRLRNFAVLIPALMT